MGRTYWHCRAMIFEVFRGDSCDHLEDWLVHGRVCRRDGLTSQNADNSVTLGK